MDVLTAFLATPEGLAVKGLLVATFVVFGLGVTAALRDKTFSLQYIDAFVRSTILGRVVPVLLVLLAGYVTGEPILTAAGVAAALAVAAGMVGSAVESVRQITTPPAESATKNTPPTA